MGKGQRVVVILDEFEELEDQINNDRIDGGIYRAIRAVTQTGRRFVIVIAGRYTLRKKIRDYSNPFFASLTPIAISHMEDTDARELVTLPVAEFLKYDSEAVDLIVSVTHGQPYLIQDLCHNIVTFLNNPLHKKDRVTAGDVRSVIDHTLQTAEGYFGGYVWDRANKSERLAMAVVADAAKTENGGWVNYSVVEKRLGREDASKSLDSLIEREILQKRPNGETLECRFPVELSRLWIRHTQPLMQILNESNMTTEEKNER